MTMLGLSAPHAILPIGRTIAKVSSTTPPTIPHLLFFICGPPGIIPSSVDALWAADKRKWHLGAISRWAGMARWWHGGTVVRDVFGLNRGRLFSRRGNAFGVG